MAIPNMVFIFNNILLEHMFKLILILIIYILKYTASHKRMVSRERSSLTLLTSRISRFLLLPLCFSKLIHQSREIKFSRIFRTLLCQHKLIQFSYHIKIFMEYFTLVNNTPRHFSAHLSVVFCHVAYLHFQHIDIFLFS